jgi:hypothetical protein
MPSTTTLTLTLTPAPMSITRRSTSCMGAPGASRPIVSSRPYAKQWQWPHMPPRWYPITSGWR